MTYNLTAANLIGYDLDSAVVFLMIIIFRFIV